MFLGGAAATTAALAVGFDFARAPAASATTIANPGTSAASVIAYARQYLGLNLPGVKLHDYAPEGAWAGYTGLWCAWFASWCLRQVGAGRCITDAAGFRGYFPEMVSPQFGDIVEFNGGSHVGIVTGVNVSIDGNRGESGGHATINKVKEGSFISPTVRYFRPPYANASGDEMPIQISADRSLPLALGTMTWAQHDAGQSWGAPLWWDNAGTNNNLAGLATTKTVFDAKAYLYLSNLPAGEFVHARFALMTRATGAVSGYASSIINGNSTGRAHGQIGTFATINQSTQALVVQAYGSIPGVQVDAWGPSAFAW